MLSAVDKYNLNIKRLSCAGFILNLEFYLIKLRLNTYIKRRETRAHEDSIPSPRHVIMSKWEHLDHTEHTWWSKFRTENHQILTSRCQGSQFSFSLELNQGPYSTNASVLPSVRLCQPTPTKAAKAIKCKSIYHSLHLFNCN